MKMEMTSEELRKTLHENISSTKCRKLAEEIVSIRYTDDFIAVHEDGSITKIPRESFYNWNIGHCEYHHTQILISIDGSGNIINKDSKYLHDWRFVANKEAMGCISNDIDSDIMTKAANVKKGKRSRWIAKGSIDELVFEYNVKLIMDSILNSDVPYPVKSEAHAVIYHAFHTYKYRVINQWNKENITPSMDSTDLPLLRIVSKINRPHKERSPGNKKAKTFDTIRLHFGLVTRDAEPERNKIIRQNKRGFAHLAWAVLKDDSYIDMPVGLLKMDRMTITYDDRLEFIFSLKDSVVKALETEQQEGEQT